MRYSFEGGRIQLLHVRCIYRTFHQSIILEFFLVVLCCPCSYVVKEIAATTAESLRNWVGRITKNTRRGIILYVVVPRSRTNYKWSIQSRVVTIMGNIDLNKTVKPFRGRQTEQNSRPSSMDFRHSEREIHKRFPHHPHIKRLSALMQIAQCRWKNFWSIILIKNYKKG